MHQEYSYQQHWQRLQLCNGAARRIQRVFRGWRARQHVVHRVRADMERLVADIWHQLSGDWARLGPASAKVPSFSLDWGPDARLRLPRMDDLLFGVSMPFPLVVLTDEEQDGIDSSNAAEPREIELAGSPNSCSLSSPNKVLSSGSAFESCPSTDDDLVIEAEPLHNSSVNLNTSPQDSLVDTVLHAETPKRGKSQQPECQVGTTVQYGNDRRTQLTSVHEILRAHSQAEILLELEWARQALCDRRKFLRSKKRVEQAAIAHTAK